MASPIIRATCGCIVIPLNRLSQLQGYVECILLKACDDHEGDRALHFGHRSFESWKVHEVPGYPRNPPPRPLTDEETDVIIHGISTLIHLGYMAKSVTGELDLIRQTKLPNVDSIQ